MKKILFLLIPIVMGNLFLIEAFPALEARELGCSSVPLSPNLNQEASSELLYRLQKKKEITVIADITFGETVPVTEVDIAALLRDRIKEAKNLGLFRKKNEETRALMRNHATTPVELSLPVTTKEKKWTFPLLKKKDLEKLDARLKAALLSEARSYAFFDADSAEQTKWAVGLGNSYEGGRLRLVSVRGDRVSFEKRTGIALYADQGGVLTRRFFVTEIPALVRITALEGRGISVPIKEAP